MNEGLTQAILGIISFMGNIANFVFTTPFPGFGDISIGGVLVALFIVSLGFHYMEYFLSGSGDEPGSNKRLKG